MVNKFIKKPVIIEAIQYTGNNEKEIIEWAHGEPTPSTEMRQAIIWHDGFSLRVNTLEGVHIANPNDWIIKGVKGEFYPCKPDIFELTYELLKEECPCKEPVLDNIGKKIIAELYGTDKSAVKLNKSCFLTFAQIDNFCHKLQPTPEPEYCEWVIPNQEIFDEEAYKTGCGKVIEYGDISDGISSGEITFCPFCGKLIKKEDSNGK
jgi:hypothetical protein